MICHELLEMKGKEKENSRQIKITKSKERGRERGRAQEKKIQTRKSLVDDNQILNDEKNKITFYKIVQKT